MVAQTLVKSAPQTQVSPVWNKPSAHSKEQQPHIINPSRSITADDEFYLRDYTIAADVISWDMGIYNTAAQLVPEDITNIAIDEDTVWYQLNNYKAIPLNIEVFHSHRSQIQLHLTTWLTEITQNQNQPNPGSTEVRPQFATVATSDVQQPEVTEQVEWTVEYDSLWGLYQAWVGERCIGKAGTYEKAERLAQQYIGTDELIRRQNGIVLAAYAM